MRDFRVVSAVAIAALCIGAPQARATLQIAADFGGSTLFCADNDGTGCDQSSAIGTIQLANQTIGGVTVNGSVQTSIGTLLTPGTPPAINTSSLSVINTTGVPVAYDVTVGDTDFTGGASSFASAGSGVFQQANGSTITLSFWNDPTNTQGADFAGDTPGTAVDTFSHTASGLADSFAHSNTGPLADGSTYSMTLDATGTLAAGGQLINRGQTLLTQIPEPDSLALLGAALLGFVALRRSMKAAA
jgi:hypothetical protein